MPLPNLITAVEMLITEREKNARATYERMLDRATAVVDYDEQQTAVGIVESMQVLGLTLKVVRRDLADRKQIGVARRTSNISATLALAPPSCSSLYTVDAANPHEDPTNIHFVRHPDQPEEHFAELVSIAGQRYRGETGDFQEKVRLLAKEGISKSFYDEESHWDCYCAQYIAKRLPIWQIRWAIAAADETYRRKTCTMKRFDFICERLGRGDMRNTAPVGLPPNGPRTY